MYEGCNNTQAHTHIVMFRTLGALFGSNKGRCIKVVSGCSKRKCTPMTIPTSIRRIMRGTNMLFKRTYLRLVLPNGFSADLPEVPLFKKSHEPHGGAQWFKDLPGTRGSVFKTYLKAVRNPFKETKSLFTGSSWISYGRYSNISCI